ncbi:MAG: tRNA preQ1(34) S-adenosylmethionine ribosyltransferase-isomerase QueA [Balneolales bacterium]|nr:tRNA preQ1(34) S-adenosylmethionine ribosyltransferase-isomerase QueA [Balneolales bacterium]
MAGKLSLSDYDYILPEKLIAQTPAMPRDHSRLLVYNRKTGTITDARFYEIGSYLTPGTTLVMNNSRVEKARLLFDNREIFITHTHNSTTVDAMVRPGRKFKAGKIVELADGITAEVISVAEDGLRRIVFNRPLDHASFEPYRHTPFPPYIKADEELAERYQTVFAKPEGSKAAPTAGLHFTNELLDNLRKGGIQTAEVTLHVGLGTFAPVKNDDITEHKLHSESWHISEKVAEKLGNASHITAVGTTSTRTLESVPGKRNFKAGSGETDIFIYPGYQFRNTDQMVTNFHLPKSTLLMMIAAFMGYDEMRRVYEHAIREEYRFYSFGDAMLIL